MKFYLLRIEGDYPIHQCYVSVFIYSLPVHIFYCKTSFQSTSLQTYPGLHMFLYFLSHLHTCGRRDESKQTSDKEEPSICLTRNLLQVFLSWSMPGGGGGEVQGDNQDVTHHHQDILLVSRTWCKVV